MRINPVVGAGHIAMISTATKLRYFLEDTYQLIGGGLKINRSNLFHKDPSNQKFQQVRPSSDGQQQRCPYWLVQVSRKVELQSPLKCEED